MARKKSRTREARQRRQNQRRQNQRSIALLGIVIVAVVAVAMVVVSSQPVETYIPPDLQARYEGIDRSLSQNGYPQLGEQDAPVTVDEYASFACPGCEVLHKDSFDAILERVRAGQILFTYVPMQTGSIPNAPGAARAALCAGQQGMFWEMHDVLFDWQTLYANTAYSQNRLLAGVAALGLNDVSFTNCFNSAAIDATLADAMTADVSGTPTIRINGVTLEAQTPGSIPSTAEILQAIDSASPKDWGLESETATDAVAGETDESPQDAPQAEAEPSAEPEVEASETDASPSQAATEGSESRSGVDENVSLPEENPDEADLPEVTEAPETDPGETSPDQEESEAESG